MLLQGSSAELDLPADSVDFIVTDPPYFDSVQYGDLAAYFHVWLRQLLPDDANWDYDLANAAVDQHANGNGQYSSVLSAIFAECRRVLKPDGRLIFTYHHRNPKGWAALTTALQYAGFILVNRYVVHSESPTSIHIANQQSLQHDVILVLRPKQAERRHDWQLPAIIDAHDSRVFCEGCGVALGAMLESNLSIHQIQLQWQQLLA
jgi:adenine-specific DNA methylase